MWNLLFHCSFSSIRLSTHTLVYTALSQFRKVFKKQISLLSAFGYGFLGSVTKTMMTAIIKPPVSNSNSYNSDTPPHSKCNINPTLKYSKGNKYKHNIKSKILSLTTKDIMQSFSRKKSLSYYNISLSYPDINTPQSSVKKVTPPPNYYYIMILLLIFYLVILNYLHCRLLLIYRIIFPLTLTTPQINLSYTMYDNQSKFPPTPNPITPKLPTPPSMNFNDIPLTPVKKCSINMTAPLKFINSVASHLIKFRSFSFYKFHHLSLSLCSSFSCFFTTAKLAFFLQSFAKLFHYPSTIFEFLYVLQLKQ